MLCGLAIFFISSAFSAAGNAETGHSMPSPSHRSEAPAVPPSVAHAGERTAELPETAREYAQFVRQTLVSLHAATGFGHMGLVLGPHQPKGFEALVQDIAARNGFTISLHRVEKQETMLQCREGIDILFFEGIEAVLLDDAPCYSPDHPDFPEMLTDLAQLGVMALSMHSTQGKAMVDKGVLAGPLDTVISLPIGPLPKMESRHNATGGGRAMLFSPLALNMNTARRIGFALPLGMKLAVGYVSDNPEPAAP